MEELVSLRLDRWLASQSTYSRKEVKALIRKGLVTVNGEVVRQGEYKVNQADTVVVNGTPVLLSQYVYYMMNKPKGVLSATRDKKASTVLDLLPTELQRPNLFPAGRLDKDTTGFLLITNDGSFAHEMLSPKNKIPKTYEAQLDQNFSLGILQEEFAKGISIGEGEETTAAQLTLLEKGEQPWVELVIYEGMFHQVKRMFRAFGLEVLELKRVKIGGLSLFPTLAEGEVTKLTAEEVKQILK